MEIVKSWESTFHYVFLKFWGVERVSFLPVVINKQAQPEAFKQGDSRFQENLDYMEWLSDQVPHSFKVEGNEVVVQTTE